MKYFYFLTALCTVPTLAMDVVYKVDDFLTTRDNIRIQACTVKQKNNTTQYREVGSILFSGDFIKYLWVQDAFQKKGIGSELFAQALDQIKASGAPKAEWFADEAVPFYLRLGAKVTEIPFSENKSAKKDSANMEFVFHRDGDARKNLEHFKKIFNPIR